MEKITKEYYDLKNEEVENVKDNLEIKKIEKIKNHCVLFKPFEISW